MQSYPRKLALPSPQPEQLSRAFTGTLLWLSTAASICRASHLGITPVPLNSARPKDSLPWLAGGRRHTNSFQETYSWQNRTDDKKFAAFSWLSKTDLMSSLHSVPEGEDAKENDNGHDTKIPREREREKSYIYSTFFSLLTQAHSLHYSSCLVLHLLWLL